MKQFNITIVYKNGLSRTTSPKMSNKAEAIRKALETDRDVNSIVSMTIIEHVREDV